MRGFNLDLFLKALTGVLIVVLGYVIVTSMQEPLVQAGDAAPSFSILTDQGKRITERDFGGRLLVLNIWATWCAPCVEEVPSLDAFQKLMKDRGVVVVGVSVDRNQAAYDKFLKRFPVSFQTARDPKQDISYSYGTFKGPETYLIDNTGKVVQKIISNRNWTDPQFISSLNL